MSSEIAELEAGIQEYTLQVRDGRPFPSISVVEMRLYANTHTQLEAVLVGLQADPDSAELLELKRELEDIISFSQQTINELRPSAPASKPVALKPAPVVNAQEKWKRENHPKFKEEAKPEEEPVAEKHNFQVNDVVLAKWYSGDRGFYPARITSITGSSVDPVYIVKFKTDDTVETLRSKDIKPVSNKRKATEAATSSSGYSSPSPVATSSGGVISAGPNIDASAKAKIDKEKMGVLDEDKPSKPKKIRATKELEKGKEKWKDWAAKGPKGVKKKESMFRTPEGVHGRVGFVGSGQTMRKDPTRSRHIYSTNGDEEGPQ